MENEGAKSPTLLSRAIVVVLIIGLVVTGSLAFSARARAEDQQLNIHDEEHDPETALFSKRGFFGFPGFGRSGQGASIEFDTLLAEALGITVEELRQAYAAAASAALDQAVTEGLLSEDQADLKRAHNALRQTINKDELVAEALGISVDEYQAAREEGKNLSTLLDELGLDAEGFNQSMRSAYQAAVEQAVRDGVITRDQADQFLNEDEIFRGRPGYRFHGGGKFRFKHHPKSETDSDPNSNTNI